MVALVTYLPENECPCPTNIHVVNLTPARMVLGGGLWDAAGHEDGALVNEMHAPM